MTKEEKQTLIETSECEWFLLCNRQTKGLVMHPILDLVPVCEPCRSQHDLKFMDLDDVELTVES